jgi:hypothetical protein
MIELGSQTAHAIPLYGHRIKVRGSEAPHSHADQVFTATSLAASSAERRNI